MTGLDPNKDRLLEVACIITDGQLKPVDEGVTYVIQTDPAVLASMDEWYVQQDLPQVCTYTLDNGRLPRIRKQASWPLVRILHAHIPTPMYAQRYLHMCSTGFLTPKRRAWQEAVSTQTRGSYKMRCLNWWIICITASSTCRPSKSWSAVGTALMPCRRNGLV